MYYFLGIETEVVLNLFCDSCGFCVWKINFIENWNHREVLFVRKEEVCNLDVRIRIVKRGCYGLGLYPLCRVDDEQNTAKS